MSTALETSVLAGLLSGALGAYGVSWLFVLFGIRWARAVLGAGLLGHLSWMVWRGVAIGFFPLTNKAESFSAAAFALALVLFWSWRADRPYALTQLTTALAAGVAAASFPQELSPPGPLLRTIWYPIHVPLSFLAFSTWVGAAGAGLTWWWGRSPEWLRRCDRFALQGFGLWSAAMICGGIWGVLAWGVYFMWDPKIIWSVVLWFHYAAFVHLRLTPSLQSRSWIRPALAWVGILWLFIAYVATSFFFGKSSHAF